ncbi:hypothetical protein [Bythopirellula polymerisocia]|uniref:Uncharacterized protein n=1 Tax=Bythopirellula polymerisocia TaxID=2528003 RepID=A0A5C6CKM4_9BACT|nr:hypothetical protein [Bythopirellula polymerisocia]TWU23676.1 hypothetical protein Pla144_38510 [Bythopirellula polymerisocia]
MSDEFALFPKLVHCSLVIFTYLASSALAILAITGPVQAQQPEAPAVVVSIAAPSTTSAALANAFANLVSASIPIEYEKRKDWGRTKEIISGLKFEDFDIKRRHKAVKHGVWKHYKVKLTDPDNKLQVRIEQLRALDGSRVAFTLTVHADLSLWGRAKVYERGVHLIALEIVGRTTMDLSLDCEIGVQIETQDLLPALDIDPRVTDAQLGLSNFRLERVSNAHGPVVKELSNTIENWIEDELRGPKLVEKLNKSIDKRRDSLRLSPSQLLDSSWWPLAELPDVATAIR